MTRAAVAALLIVVCGSARADAPWRYGVAAVSRVDFDGDGGFGVAVAAVQERPQYSVGAVLEHTWLLPQRQELGIRQLDAIGLVRWGRPLAVEVGAGLALYHGRVDLPGDCYGCGMYGGSSLALVARAGVVWAYPLRGRLALELGARLVVARASATAIGTHSFVPQPVAFQSGVGVTSRF